MKKPASNAAIPAPWSPADWELADASAIQAVARGEADSGQQQRCLNWLINNAALTYDLEYRTEGRDHAFASGRRFVGLQIIKMLKLNVAALAGTKTGKASEQG